MPFVLSLYRRFSVQCHFFDRQDATSLSASRTKHAWLAVHATPSHSSPTPTYFASTHCGRTWWPIVRLQT